MIKVMIKEMVKEMYEVYSMEYEIWDIRDAKDDGANERYHKWVIN
jgi:hypothetical protein